MGEIYDYSLDKRVRVVVFNTTFNSISAMLWRSVLLEEETGVPIENHQPVVSQTNLIT
jgi:hypothetical protein